MRYVILTIIALTSLVLSGASFAANSSSSSEPSPNGLWLTENQRSVISVESCPGDKNLICGHIHWIIREGMQYDSKNPDASRRNAPMCGLKLMWGFHQNDAMNWIDGHIYKADEGDTYNATIQMLPSGKMLVRGYVGMPLFGKSQTWTRVSTKDYPRCKPAK
ncbi:MAG: hypothetical protein JWO78_1345 [Micavibrio sp.]|nr:hypothetical protein [Micavibrio sp.]